MIHLDAENVMGGIAGKIGDSHINFSNLLCILDTQWADGSRFHVR